MEVVVNGGYTVDLVLYKTELDPLWKVARVVYDWFQLFSPDLTSYQNIYFSVYIHCTDSEKLSRTVGDEARKY